MAKIKLLLAGLLLMGGLAVATPAYEASAVNVFNRACSNSNTTAVCSSRSDNASSMVTPIVSILLWAVGAVSVIVIIIGGIMYATSAGDPGRVKKAKDAILYAVVGLVVAILAFAIVNFVVDRL